MSNAEVSQQERDDKYFNVLAAVTNEYREYKLLMCGKPEASTAIRAAEELLSLRHAERGGMMSANALGEGRERGILREASSGDAATSTDGLGG